MKTNHIDTRAGKPSRPNRISRKLGVAAFALTSMFAVAAPAQASDRTADRIAATIVGAGFGAILGDHIGGRDGAKVGGLLGATIGLTATAHASHRHNRHVRVHDNHQPHYGDRYSHHPVYDNHRSAHKKARKFDRGHSRGYNDGLRAYKGQSVRYAQRVENDLSHRHPRYVKGYRVGFQSGLTEARKIERRRIRHARRHQRQEMYYPNRSTHNYGKIRHHRVNKPVYRENKPRHQRRHSHGGSSNHPHIADRP